MLGWRRIGKQVLSPHSPLLWVLAAVAAVGPTVLAWYAWRLYETHVAPFKPHADLGGGGGHQHGDGDDAELAYGDHRHTTRLPWLSLHDPGGGGGSGGSPVGPSEAYRAAYTAAVAALGSPATVTAAIVTSLSIAAPLELGWRGFLAPHLLRFYAPLRSALVGGCLACGCSLLPAFIDQVSTGAHPPAAALLAALTGVAIIPRTLLVFALYLASRGNLALCASYTAAAAVAATLAGSPMAATELTTRSAYAIVTVFVTNAAALPAIAYLWREGARRRRRWRAAGAAVDAGTRKDE
jgi:hypothetical protein